jgi:hypothetical protein
MDKVPLAYPGQKILGGQGFMEEYIPGNYMGAITRAHEIFKTANPGDMVLGSGANFDKEKSCFFLKYCNIPIEVHYPSGTAHWLKPEKKVINVSDRYLILLYLAQGSGLPLRNNWLTFLELPGGPHHYAPFLKEGVEPLVEAFGKNPEEAWVAAKSFGATRITMGSVGFIMPVLPKLPLAFVFWEGDEEFPPKANILFDQISSDYLDTASLYILGINAARKLIIRNFHL